MIKGVLGELVPEEEASRMEAAVEEEGSSSTPGKKDTDNERITTENQAVEVAFEQADIPYLNL